MRASRRGRGTLGPIVAVLATALLVIAAGCESDAQRAERERLDRLAVETCLKSCDRLKTCGMANLEMLRPLTSPDKYQKNVAQVESSMKQCRAACDSGATASDQDREMEIKMRVCLEQADCAAFMRCVQALSPGRADKKE